MTTLIDYTKKIVDRLKSLDLGIEEVNFDVGVTDNYCYGSSFDVKEDSTNRVKFKVKLK